MIRFSEVTLFARVLENVRGDDQALDWAAVDAFHRPVGEDAVGHETQPVELSKKIAVVPVAPLFAEAIQRIHRRESISVLFQD